MSDDGRAFDDRNVSYREFAGAVLRSSEEMARLRERQATTEATLLHEMSAVRGDVGELKQIILRQPAREVDHNALVMTRALDMLDNKKGGGLSPFLIIFAVLGALVVGFGLARLLGGV